MSAIEILSLVSIAAVAAYYLGAWSGICSERSLAEGAGAGRYEIDPESGRWVFMYGLPEEEP